MDYISISIWPEKIKTTVLFLLAIFVVLTIGGFITSSLDGSLNFIEPISFASIYTIYLGIIYSIVYSISFVLGLIFPSLRTSW